MATVDNIPFGWSVSEKYRQVLSKLPSQSEVVTHLLNTDMREYGVSWVESKKDKDSLEADKQVLQIARVRNIAISQAEEDFLAFSDSAVSTSRLLKLTLTDGKSNILALDVDNSPQLSSETPPGTKIRLNGRVQIRGGFLILRRNNFEVLKGSVDLLRREWLLTRDAKGTRRAHRTGPDAPPPFVAFGTPEASALIESHARFLNELSARNRRSEETFDSLKLAMEATSKANAAPAGDESDFQQKRREILAEAQNALSTGDADLSQHKFKAGVSKFQQARVDLAVERDLNLSQLVSMGYQIHEAKTALEESNNSLEGAIDRLTSRQLGQSLGSRRGTRGGGVRGQGRARRGADRGEKFAYDIEEDPRFDPVAEAEKAGLRGKPYSGPVPLSEFMDRPPPPKPGSSRPTETMSVNSRLTPGTVLQARVMSGDYKAARFINLLPTKVTGEHVAIVSYLETEEREEVPLSMLRTLDNGEVTTDMLESAPLPAHRTMEIPRGGGRGGGDRGGRRGAPSGRFRGGGRGRGGFPRHDSRGRGSYRRG